MHANSIVTVSKNSKLLKIKIYSGYLAESGIVKQKKYEFKLLNDNFFRYNSTLCLTLDNVNTRF
jgi:hypothetical protein